MATKTKAKPVAKKPAVKKPAVKKPAAKKPAAKKPSRGLDYESIRREVEKPTAARASITTRRGNERTPRRYHMTRAKMDKLITESQSTGEFPNPYRKGGIYHAIVQALANLGKNQRHTFEALKSEIKKVLSGFTTKDKKNAWDVFANRPARNELSGKDVAGRILQNAMVLQRLSGFHLYGEKLRQLCACIDIFRDKDGLPLFRLNTKFPVPKDVAPINEMRSMKNRGRRNAAPSAKPKAKKAVKKTPAKKAAKKTPAKPPSKEPAKAS